MPIANRDLVQILKAELNYLSEVGYGQAQKAPRRAPLVFEDTPSCINCDSKREPSPCSECALIQLVPLESRDEKAPCRHIPITSDGETIMDLYRYSSQAELENVLGRWLREVIEELEAAPPDAEVRNTKVVQQQAPDKSTEEQLVN